jgi:Zn-dependent protease
LSFNVVNIAIQLAVILFAISLHESSHAWMALQFGDTTARDHGRISLNPLHHIDPFGTVLLPIICVLLHAPVFGYARPTPVDLRNTRNPRLANFWVSAAGPGSNFLAGGIGMLLLVLIRQSDPLLVRGVLFAFVRNAMPGQGGVLVPLVYMGVAFVIINIILGIFNLIPIPPMDGSGILFSILGPRGMALEIFFQRNALLMFIVIMGLLYLGLFNLILGPPINWALNLIAGTP